MEELEDLLVHSPKKIKKKKKFKGPSVRQEKSHAAVATIHDEKTTCYSAAKSVGILLGK